ncbi:MAG: purine nucleoside phosphoramidase [Actinomycetota bacterium]
MSDCLFCKIAAGVIPANFVYQSDEVLAFLDIAPVAPVHIVVIPRKHYTNVSELSADSEISAALLKVMAELGDENCQSGYRLVFNTGDDGGQTVFHVHGHVLGQRAMQWPPG